MADQQKYTVVVVERYELAYKIRARSAQEAKEIYENDPPPDPDREDCLECVVDRVLDGNGNDVTAQMRPKPLVLRAEETREKRQIFARFQPQAWINDFAVNVDGVVDFDVTDQILAMGCQQALKIKDDSYEADELWYQAPESDDHEHQGPFAVSVELAIRNYFDDKGEKPKIEEGESPTS